MKVLPLDFPGSHVERSLPFCLMNITHDIARIGTLSFSLSAQISGLIDLTSRRLLG